MSVYAQGSEGHEAEDHHAEQDEPRTKLIVNYLPQSLTDVQLISIFSRIGPVVAGKIIRDQHTNYSYGYGFIEYTNASDAEEAINQLRGYQIQNKRLGVAYARPHDKETLKNTNLYVSSIPDTHANEDGLRSLFEEFGKIINIKVLTDTRTHETRGSAFVRFDRREEAEKAIEALDGFMVSGSFQPLSVKVSEEHGKQKANFFANYVNPPQQFYNHGGYFRGHPGGQGGRYNGRGNYDQRRGGGGRGGYYPRGGGGRGHFQPRGGGDQSY